MGENAVLGSIVAAEIKIFFKTPHSLRLPNSLDVWLMIWYLTRVLRRIRTELA